MSEPVRSIPNGSILNGAETSELDIPKLHALPTEQQDLYILTYISDLRENVSKIPSEILPERQASIKREILKIIGLGLPIPPRIIRDNLAKVLADTFERGSRSLLFETINELVTLLNTGKGEKEIGTKHGAIVCLGEIFLSAGDSAISLSGLVVQTLLKSLKSSHVGLRGCVFRALGSLVRGIRTSLDEHVGRDIWKNARNAVSNDKSSFVQRSACDCLRYLITETTFFNNSNDFDNLKTCVWKAMESTAATVRRAAAGAISASLIQAYSESSSADMPIIRKPKKSSKKQITQTDDDIEQERPGTPPTSQGKSTVNLTLSLQEILRVLSIQYCRASTTNRARGGIATIYKFVLRGLPPKVVEQNYDGVASHFLYELINHPTISVNTYRLLLTRRFVQTLLNETIAAHLLTENSQINAARYLINNVLKNYPQVLQDRKEPSKRVLASALDALAGLLKHLGSAANIFQDSCREAILQVMQHPSFTVQSYVAKCSKLFTMACPSQIAPIVEHAMLQLPKSIETKPESRFGTRRSIGYAMSVAAILTSASKKPLYCSIELFGRIFSYATELLKYSAASELRLSAAQIQVAWTLIGGLMSLGPSFVKVHLNQLLILWRNALPPPLSPENATKRGQLEMSFLTHVRECALSSLLLFLDSASTLITSDGSRRIALMLQNTVLFLETLPTTRHSEEISNRLVPSLQLQDLAIILRRRTLQCFSSLLELKNLDQADVVSQSDLMSLSTQIFTNPERHAQKTVEASLATSASSFEGLWEIGDNWGFGVSSLVLDSDIYFPTGSRFDKMQSSMDSSEDINPIFDGAPRHPAQTALEHDPAMLSRLDDISEPAELSPPATTCVNMAIKLFAIAFPLQPARIQESCLEQLTTILSQPLQREPGRKAAMQFNSALALLFTLIVANRETSFSAGRLQIQSMGKIMRDILRTCLEASDPVLRSIGARALGRLCNLAGTQFTNTEVKYLIDMIVSNRDPHSRAGYALALGFIHSEVGAMAASLHIKSIVGVLLSLCNDAHPIVHFWALKGLIQLTESAGLTFSAYATSTLGMLAQLYSSDNHNEQASSLPSSNQEVEYSTPAAIAQCVDSIINVLGPDLQDVSKARNLILSLVGYLQKEESNVLVYQSYVCLRHLSMYVPAHLQSEKYVQDLESCLRSKSEALCRVSVVGLGDLIKRSASEVARMASSKLNDELWTRLDQNPEDLILKTLLRNWMQQTSLTRTTEWIERCQLVLSKTRVKSEPQPRTANPRSAMPDLADDEVAGFAAAAQGETGDLASEGQEFLRWQTRDFAMQILSELIDIVQASMLPDRVVPAEETLQSRVAEIVRIAFSASTANVVELRIWGLRILDQVLKLFGKTPDPDFLEASLLEQYQAQISSALTPAFSVDSSPELAAEAIAVCATFVATGIVTNADRMGRIFKVLAVGVENLVELTPDSSIGDLKNLTPNAQAMLKMAILTGWAQLELASTEQTYLEAILQPFVPKLAPLWLSSLQEFAALRFEPEISDTLGGDIVSASLDERYASFNQVVRLNFYQGSWLSIVDAIALLVEKDSESVFDALDKKQTSSSKKQEADLTQEGKDMSFREEPVAFFFILFGLAFESLVTRTRDDPSQALSILQALKKILTPTVCGNAIYETAVFNETTDTLDRLALTSDSQTQWVLVEIARNLSLDHLSAKDVHERDEKLSDDIEQLFDLTRIIILVLSGLIPTLEDPPGSAFRKLANDGIALVQLCFQALVDVAEVFPSIIRADLHSCILHCYCIILGTGICQDEVVPTIMPIFRMFLTDVIKASDEETSSRLVRGCLHRMLSILSFAQRRENDYAIKCAKNTLLSITVLITSASVVLPVEDSSVDNAISEILDCLQDVGLAKIAAGCIRSLLLIDTKTACDQHINRILWPQIITFINNTSIEDPEKVRTPLIQALVTSISSLKGNGRYAAMTILVPLLLSRADHSVPNGSKDDLRKDSAMRLLDLATADQYIFRLTITSLDETQKKNLEGLLRLTGIGKKHETVQEDDVDTMPAIELRMDF